MVILSQDGIKKEEEKYNSPEKDAEGKISPAMNQIEELKTRIGKLEVQLKKEKISVPHEREQKIKEEIKNYLRELQKTPDFAAPPAVRDEARELKNFPASQQVGALISLVFDKGLVSAIAVARDLNNPAVLDEFHDMLADRYYNMLIEKKLLKPA